MVGLSSIAQSGVKDLDEVLKGGFIRPSNLMITGAPFSGKKLLGYQILNRGLELGEAAIFVSTSNTAEEVLEDWCNFGLDINFEEDGRVKFVDCYSKMLGLECGDTTSIRRIPSVLDFTKLSVAINDLVLNFLSMKIDARLVFDSLSALLTYSSLQVVMRFLHVFMGKMRRQRLLSLFMLEEGTHDDVTFNLLQTFSNGVIHMNQENKTLDLVGFGGYGKIPLSYDLTDEGVIVKKVLNEEMRS